MVPQKGDLVLPKYQVHMVDETLTRAHNPLTDAVAALRTSDIVDSAADAASGDILRYPAISRILGVWGWDPDSGRHLLRQWGIASLSGLAAGQLEAFYAAALPQYSAGSYELRDGNVMHWRPGQGPQPGTGYTVKYEASAVFIVADDAAFRADGDIKLQHRPVMLKRYDALGQEMKLRGHI